MRVIVQAVANKRRNMKIGFTGHRNKMVSHEDLEKLMIIYPGSTWIHGGAVGFDQQVESFANKNKIQQIVHHPDYKQYGKAAPLIRNRKIVEDVDILIACWDGRKQGGTYYTINFASKSKKQIKILSTV